MSFSSGSRPARLKLAPKSRPQPGLDSANSLTAEAQRHRRVPLREALDVKCLVDPPNFGFQRRQISLDHCDCSFIGPVFRGLPDSVSLQGQGAQEE